MQDWEKQKFEESWKKAFDGAEMTPPDRVWNSIELDLAGQESAVMKKKVVFYQALAAAMVIFALAVGTYAFYDDVTKNEVTRDEVTKDEVMKPDIKGHQQGERAGVRERSKETFIAKSNDIYVGSGNDHSITEKKKVEEQPLIALQTDNIIASNEGEQSTIVDKKEEERKDAEVVAAPPIQILEAPDEIVPPKRTKASNENLWLALGASAGNYTPNTPTATNSSTQSSFGDPRSFALTTVAPTPQPKPKVGASYSVGVGIGKRFGRVIVQTGVNFIKQQISYTSIYDTHTPSNVAKAAMSDYLAQNTALTYTNEYPVNSTMQIVSIPVQVGYMIIDRRLGWQVNGGVSNDFFLRNVLVDESGQRGKFTQDAGTSSPYRSVNWSALASTELSYRIGQHYRLSLVPGARYSFNSILKNATDNGRPIVLDVGFRFRYIFD